LRTTLFLPFTKKVLTVRAPDAPQFAVARLIILFAETPGNLMF
jgi:hypothetical protein